MSHEPRGHVDIIWETAESKAAPVHCFLKQWKGEIWYGENKSVSKYPCIKIGTNKASLNYQNTAQ